MQQLLMINIQKLLHSHKQWQDYNKQDDVGLMTLYQNQQATQELINKQRQKKKIELQTIQQSIEEHQESARYKSTEAKVQSKKRFKTPTKKIQEVVIPQRVNKTTLKRRNNNSKIQKQSNLFKLQRQPRHDRNDESERKGRQQKQVIKVGYYDVGHMSTVLNSRSLKKISVVSELSKAKRRIATETNEQHTEYEKKQTIKILQSKKSQNISHKKQREYREAYLKGIKNLLQQNHLKAIQLSPHIETSQSCKNYKMLNLDRFKMRKKNKDFHANFKRQFNTMSQRYKMSLIEDQNPSKVSPLKFRPHLQPLSSDYISLQSNTLSNERAEQQHRLKQIISMFFTKQSQQSTSRLTIFQ